MITTAIEPINRYESFLIYTCDQGIKLMQMIDESNVKINFVAYHMNLEKNDFYQPTLNAAPHLCHHH